MNRSIFVRKLVLKCASWRECANIYNSLIQISTRTQFSSKQKKFRTKQNKENKIYANDKQYNNYFYENEINKAQFKKRSGNWEKGMGVEENWRNYHS